MRPPIQFADRKWTRPPEQVRALAGPAATNWTEDQLYQFDQLCAGVARIALRDHLRSRRGESCVTTAPHGPN